MKTILLFIFLIPIAVALGIVPETSSHIPDKKKPQKKKEAPHTVILLRDTSNCANYYEAKALLKPGKHSAACSSDCKIFHIETVILEKTLKRCPAGQLYNPRKLACDSIKNIETCTHTPKCTND